jgi:hypothetical protein
MVGEPSYQKLRRRGAFDFPVLGVAAYVRFDGASMMAARSRMRGSFSGELLHHRCK